ncbi:MAG: tetratricopeptide repeat protein [Acidobacteriota bacterium]
MRLKTAVVTAFLLLLLIFLLGLVSLNGPLLASPFDLFGMRVPTGWVLALALLLGFLAFFLWLVVSGTAEVVRRWFRSLAQQSERAAEEAYLKGLDAALGSRPLEAIAHFQRSLEAFPGYLPALLQLGNALRQAGRPREALVYHLKALEHRPKDVPTLYALAEDAILMEDHEEAKRHLRAIQDLQPRRALKALRMLRTLYIRESNWTAALEIQRNITAARVREEERAEDAPYTPGLLYQIGVDLLAQERNREAAQQFQKVRAKYPHFQPAYLKLAEALLLEGREEEAVEVYLDGYRRNASPPCLLAMEQLYLDKGDPEGAIARYRALIDSADRKVLPKFLLGRFYYRLEAYDRAEALFREIRENIGQSGLLEYYLGRIRERRGDTAAACGHYREVIRILNPFELNYTCSGCGAKAPEWRDFCSTCLKWDTFAPLFRDELLQELQAPRPVFYEGVPWNR